MDGPLLLEVLAHWLTDPRSATIQPWAAGGLSGARVWRVDVGGTTYALRQWPSGNPSVERLEGIHRVLQVVRKAGHPPIAAPLATGAGRTFIEAHDRLWQLETWMPGAPHPEGIPEKTRLQAAFRALAQFHAASAACGVHPGPSPGLAMRCAEASQLESRFAEYQKALDRQLEHPLAPIAARLLPLVRIHQAQVVQQLRQVVARDVRLQWCIRDIWREHVFFQENEVSGLIDFGGVGQENPAADVARLAGSLAEDDPTRWQWALEAYQQLSPLGTDEQRLIGVFDRANTLLGGILWIRWLFIEHRSFPSLRPVAARLAYFQRRLGAIAPG